MAKDGLVAETGELAAIQGLRDTLDACAVLARTRGAPEAIHKVTEALAVLEAEHGPSGLWRSRLVPEARAHPFSALMHQCPLTAHSFRRPRGYPGDADLLDIIYRHPDGRSFEDHATAFGADAFAFTIDVAACEAVRARKTLLAERIDAVAVQRPGAEVLSVACGHLREAETSRAVQNRQIARLVATDQDADSLALVANSPAARAGLVEARRVTVRNFLGKRHDLGPFDFVYAAGLYDYLEERAAKRLTQALFGLLKDGGRLLVANFLTGIWEAAYMEVYMDWPLIYRSREEIIGFADLIPAGQLARRDYFEDASQTIGFLELFKA